MTSLVWLVFALYLNQMSHLTIFLTSRLRAMRTRNPTKFQYISVPYGHVIVLLRVPLLILQLVDLQEPVAPYSYKRLFKIFSIVLLLLLLFYYFIRLLPKLLLDVEDIPLVSSLHNYNGISLPTLTWPRLSCASHQNPVDAYFCQGEIEEPVYDRLFTCHPLLKTRSS